MSSGKHHDHTKVYVGVFLTLLLLTFITVKVTEFDLSHLFQSANIVVAMIIATIKATVVALFFMHLNEDKAENVIIFTSSFLFLLIFIGLAGGDIFTRKPDPEITITPVEIPIALQMGQMAELNKPNASLKNKLIEEGKGIYTVQCVSCHGAEGKGNGPAASSFNPRPRNFTAEKFENGGAPAQLFDTLGKGLRKMPAFSSLSLRDRWAVVHYIRTFVSNPENDTPKTLALIGLSADGSVDSSNQADIKPELPVEFIIDRILAEQ